MRNFIIVGHKAVTNANFSLNDLPGSAGRMDILCRCINSAFFLSHDIRRNVCADLVLLGEPDPPKTIRFDGSRLRYLNPDERSAGSLIKKALDLKVTGSWQESTYGVFIKRGGLTDAISGHVTGGDNLYYLREDGRDIRDIQDISRIDGEEPVTFILGDHTGMEPEEEELISRAGAVTISVGPESLHADHCIILIHNELDRSK